MNCTKLAALTGAAALAFAAGAIAVAPVAIPDVSVIAEDGTSIEGSVKSIDSSAKSFVVTSEGRDITVRTDRNTKFLLDGKDSTMEEVVKVGSKVTVHHKDGLASKVSMTTKNPPTPPTPPSRPE